MHQTEHKLIMDIKIEKLKKSRVKLTVEVEPKELVKYFRDAYENLAKDVKIDGFRPGKAPFKLIEAKIGHNRLVTEGADHALQGSYPLACQKENIHPLSQPKVDVKKMPGFSLDETEIKDKFIYTVEVDILPKIVLKDYRKLSVKKPSKRTPKKADVDKIITHLRKQKATFVEITRPIKKGDRVEIDFEGYLKKVKIDKMCSKNHPLILGEGNLIPGFEDKLVGKKKGDKVGFKIKFPKDYHAKELVSKEAEFKVKINDAKEVSLPKLDNKFVANYGHKTVKQLENAVKESLVKEMDLEYNNKLELKVIEKVIPLVSVEVPDILIWQETEKTLENYKNQIESQGLQFDKYLESIKKTSEDIQKDMRPQAEKNVKIGFILGKIIEERKIDAKDKEAGRKALDYLVETIVKK